MRILRSLRAPVLLLALLVVIMGLQRLLFFALNADAFPNPPFAAFLSGIRFDLSAIAWLNLPWLALLVLSPQHSAGLATVRKWVFIVANALGFFFNCVDLEYYKFTLKRSTADLFAIATGGSDIWHVMPVFLVDYWYVVIIFLVSVGVLIVGYNGIHRSEPNTEAPTWPGRLIWRAIPVAMFFLFSRGGFQLIPLQPLDAATHASPAYIPLVLNSPFTLMTSFGKPMIEERNYMSKEEADKTWPVEHQYGLGWRITPFAPEYSASALRVTLRSGSIGLDRWDSLKFDPCNVVVIMLESFSAAYSDTLSHRGLGCMPFLDSLMGQSLNCTNAFANGRRSIDGVPAILASMPRLMDEAFITSPYATTPFTSIASVLGSNGYGTTFFHGGHNGTMGFDAFCGSAGFKEYVGRDQYPDAKDDDGVWGIRDRPFLQFVAQQLNKKQQPFMAAIFTLSSHHPYQLEPAEAERFKGGDHKIMPTLRYADDALRRFFATARTMPWFNNTLFVITADHTADLDRDGQTSNRAADYWIPLLFYRPGQIAPAKHTSVTQQIDIVPTVLDMMNYDRRFISFGNSILRSDRPHCAVVSNNNVYLAIGDLDLLQFDGKKVIEPVPGGPGSPGALMLEHELKAAIQQFNSHLLSKELVARP